MKKLMKSLQQPGNCLERKCSLSINLVRALAPPGESQQWGMRGTTQEGLSYAGRISYMLREWQRMFILPFFSQHLPRAYSLPGPITKLGIEKVRHAHSLFQETRKAKLQAAHKHVRDTYKECRRAEERGDSLPSQNYWEPSLPFILL